MKSIPLSTLGVGWKINSADVFYIQRKDFGWSFRMHERRLVFRKKISTARCAAVNATKGDRTSDSSQQWIVKHEVVLGGTKSPYFQQ